MTNEQKKIYLSKVKEYIDIGNLEVAKDILIECLRLDYNDTDFINSLAKVEYRIGNKHKAGYLLNESIKKNMDTKTLETLDKIKQNINNNNTTEKLITASFIVKNEESCLETALNSIKDIADEIIVVDTGSTDNTVGIAQSFGAKIYYFDWINDYSAARNISIKYATSKWVLYLDADEELPQASRSIIRDLAKNSDGKTGGFLCNIISPYLKYDGEIDYYPGQYPRFFRNIGYPLLHFFGKVHEQISPSLVDNGYHNSESQIQIDHHGYAISQEEMKIKLSGHIKVLTEDVRDNPENGYTWYHLGNTLYQMKRYVECREVLENALRCRNLTSYLSANTALLLSRVMENLGDMKSAFSFAHQSNEFIDKYEPALIRKAEILEKLGKLDNFIKKS